MIYFDFRELIQPELEYKGEEACFNLFYPHFLQGLDLLRKDFGKPIIINNWHIGGNLKHCGYRLKRCKIGAANSFHKAGGAFDLHTKTEKDRLELIELIKKQYYMYNIRRMENPESTPNWVHIDCKEHSRVGLHIFTP